MKKLLVLFMAAAMFVGAALTSTQAFAADHTLRIVFLGNTEDEDYDGSLVFKNHVEAASNGAIEVEVYPGGQLCGNAKECIEALQSNLIQIHIATFGGFAPAMPEIQVLDLPYMLDGDRMAEKVLNGPFLTELRKEVLDKTGLRLMCIGNTGGWRNIANTKRQIRTPEDMKGLKIRTISSPLQQELVKLMGAAATPVAWPEVYTSLATGVIDGSKNGITDIVGMKFHEHIKHMTLDGHAYMGAMWLMNNDAYNALDQRLQRVVQDGFEALRQVQTALPKRRSIEAYQEFVKAGGTIYVPTPEEKAKFQAAAAPLKQWYLDKYGEYGKKLLGMYEKYIAEAKAELEEKYNANR